MMLNIEACVSSRIYTGTEVVGSIATIKLQLEGSRAVSIFLLSDVWKHFTNHTLKDIVDKLQQPDMELLSTLSSSGICAWHGQVAPACMLLMPWDPVL